VLARTAVRAAGGHLTRPGASAELTIARRTRPPAPAPRVPDGAPSIAPPEGIESTAAAAATGGSGALPGGIVRG
jgi:hypothetical protein